MATAMIDDKHIRSFLFLWTNIWLGLWHDCLDCVSRVLWIWQGAWKSDVDESVKFVDKLRDEWADREHDIYVKMQPLKTRDAIGILKKEEK